MSLEKEISELLEVMQIMRDPQKGCAWTRAQTNESLIRHTIEEAYEVAETIESGHLNNLKGELADLLNQVIFYAQIAKESNHFDFKSIVMHLKQKLIDRHPDVFAQQKNQSVKFLEDQWESIKKQERKPSKSILDEIAHNLPALSVANKLQMRASTVGFDWTNKQEVLAKLKSEVLELEEAFCKENENENEILEELGDVMFSCVNLARHMKADSEQVMRRANRKFESRFRALEREFQKQGQKIEEATSDQLELVWEFIKSKEK